MMLLLLAQIMVRQIHSYVAERITYDLEGNLSPFYANSIADVLSV